MRFMAASDLRRALRRHGPLIVATGVAALVVTWATEARAGTALRARPISPKSPAFPDEQLGHATLTRALQDLDVRETGYNEGPRIGEYQALVGLESGQPWCAAAIAKWMHEAADVLGVEPPIQGSGSSLTTREQFKEAGLWVPIEEIRSRSLHVEPGSIVIWQRPEAGPWKGHIAVVENWDNGQQLVSSIDGNSGPTGDRVARRSRSVTDPNLLGVGLLL